ncbi:torsin-1A-interacting protein 2-like [Arapaima gigas]
MTRTRLQDTRHDSGKTQEGLHKRTKKNKEEVQRSNGSEDHVAALDSEEGSPNKICELTESGEDGITNESEKDVVGEDGGDEVMTTKMSHYYSQGDAEHKSTFEEHRMVKKEKCRASRLADGHKLASLRRRPIHSKILEADSGFVRSAQVWSQSVWLPETKSDSALLLTYCCSSTSTTEKHDNKLDYMKEPPHSTLCLEKSDPCRELTAGAKKTAGLKQFIWILVLLTVAILFALFCKTNSTDRVMEKDFRILLEGVKSKYPSQQEQLWKKSMIHLQQNIRTTKPTEPVTLILTAGQKAEKTLRCLAGHLAAAFSSAFHASVLHIDGASWSALDSNEAKLAIDQELSGAFESNKMAAVIHRFEELPPGSALIFYRYCDHENAAYKAALFVFTVLLSVEMLDPALGLVAVEEMVRDHIQARFLPLALPGAFNQMDMDKFGGLWSRISHLVLPVVAEEQTEKNGCHG